MKQFPLNLADLVPREATFKLGGIDKPITLCRWSLRVRAWATDKYTSQGLKKIFEEQRIVEIADMAFFMLKDKEQFKTRDDFMDAISTIKDQVEVIKALLATVGIGEPEIEKITESIKKDAVAPSVEGDKPGPKTQAKRKIGAKSSTP